MNMQLINRSAMVMGVLLTIGLPVSDLLAQEESEQRLEEITVTAAYRAQGLQDVPVSISAVSGDTIADIGIQRAEDIQFLVPNFSTSSELISCRIASNTARN